MLRSSVAFGAFLAYAPRGTTQLAKQSREVCYSIKQDSHIRGTRTIPFSVAKLRESLTPELETLLAPDAILVPAPRSAPFAPRQRDVLWVPRRICEELVKAGFGAAVEPWLIRVEAVPKSSTAGPGERATVRKHYGSMDLDQRLTDAPGRIVLVDDVVTTGATLLAGVSVIADNFPSVPIQAFALVRKVEEEDLERIVMPVVGTISLEGFGTARTP